MEDAGKGTLGVLSSVAGDRGRAENYVYGASKAALSAYASGLGQRLAKKGVVVVTVKPGPVATPMTVSRTARPGLLADVDDVGRRVHKALERGWRVVYAPAYWRLVMGVLKLLPTALFREAADVRRGLGRCCAVAGLPATVCPRRVSEAAAASPPRRHAGGFRIFASSVQGPSAAATEGTRRAVRANFNATSSGCGAFVSGHAEPSTQAEAVLEGSPLPGGFPGARLC